MGAQANKTPDGRRTTGMHAEGYVIRYASGRRANRRVVFLIVGDLAAERRRLEGVGIALGADIPGDYSTLAQVRDADGNLLTLASPPSRPYPRA